jgi:hypothetical protein
MNTYPRPLPYAPVIRRIELPRHLVTVACVYEAIALLTRRIPTLSTLTWHHRALAFPILLGLAVHLLRAPVVVVVGS